MPKSIIDIDVNDEAFKRFLELYKTYESQLGKMKGLWGEIEGATASATGAAHDASEATETTAKHAQSSADSFAAGALSAVAIFEAMHDASDEVDKVSSAAARSVSPFAALERHTASIASSIAHATLNLAKWAALSLGAGLIGVGGGLWGIDSLANAVSGQRKSAQGLGLTTAEQQAFNVNFGSRLVGGDFLSNVQNTKSDLGQQWQFSALGIPQSEVQTGDAAELGIDVIRRAQQLWQQAGPGGHNQQYMQAHGLAGFMDFSTWQRIGQMSPQKMQEYEGQYRKDVGTMGAPNAVQTAWQDFSVQMQRAGDQIEAVFVKGLAPLIPSLTHLSESIEKALAGFLGNPHLKEWIDDIAGAVERLATYLGSDSFQADLKVLIDGIAALAGKMREFLGWMGGGASGGDETPDDPTGGIHRFVRAHPVPSGGGFGINPSAEPGRGPHVELTPGGPGSRFLRWFHGDGDTLHPGSFTGGANRDYYNPPPLAPDTAAEVAQRALAVGLQPSFLQDLARAEGGTSTSPAGAIGTMQLMPGTAAEVGVDPNDPHQNIQGGVTYFKMLLDRFGGNYLAAAAAYNAGPHGKGVEYYAETGDESQIPAETRKYIHTIQHLQQDREGHGAPASKPQGDDVNTVMHRLRTAPQNQRMTVNVNVTNQTGANVAVLANATQQ